MLSPRRKTRAMSGTRAREEKSPDVTALAMWVRLPPSAHRPVSLPWDSPPPATLKPSFPFCVRPPLRTSSMQLFSPLSFVTVGHVYYLTATSHLEMSSECNFHSYFISKFEVKQARLNTCVVLITASGHFHISLGLL